MFIRDIKEVFILSKGNVIILIFLLKIHIREVQFTVLVSVRKSLYLLYVHFRLESITLFALVLRSYCFDYYWLYVVLYCHISPFTLITLESPPPEKFRQDNAVEHSHENLDEMNDEIQPNPANDIIVEI